MFLVRTLEEIAFTLKEVDECYTEIPERMFAALRGAIEVCEQAETLKCALDAADKDTAYADEVGEPLSV